MIKNILLNHKSGVIQRLVGWYRYRKERSEWQKHENWDHRVSIAKQCPDNLRIVRLENAGKEIDGWITMHNGLLVESGGYYGEKGNPLLTENAGVHEPQEEFLFDEVIKQLPQTASMLEVGAYWGFYTMSFAKAVSAYTCYLVEAESENIEVGKRNLAHNGIKGTFLHGFIGAKNDVNSTPATYTIDELFGRFGIDKLTILHADIQSHELSMLAGAQKVLQEKRVDVWFISTHSNHLHYSCKSVLENAGYEVPWSIDLIDSYSFDGLLVACLPGKIKTEEIQVSLRSESKNY
jgi:hypothetical protein